MSYELIKKYYQDGSLFTEADLDLFVKVGWITEDQKQEIINNK